MNSGGTSSKAVVQGKEGAGHLSQQQPARLTTQRSRQSTAGAGEGESLPEWKLHCLCHEQSLLSPTIKGGLHVGGGWL